MLAEVHLKLELHIARQKKEQFMMISSVKIVKSQNYNDHVWHLPVNIVGFRHNGVSVQQYAAKGFRLEPLSVVNLMVK
jgi:hypothetical protein